MQSKARTAGVTPTWYDLTHRICKSPMDAKRSSLAPICNYVNQHPSDDDIAAHTQNGETLKSTWRSCVDEDGHLLPSKLNDSGCKAIQEAGGDPFLVGYGAQWCWPKVIEDQVLQWLMDKRIKLVAWDFDRTILTVHTGGAVASTGVGDLTAKVSPDFLCFQELLHQYRPDIVQAVVTYSDVRMVVHNPSAFVAGESLVRPVLAAVLGVSRASEFVIVGHYPALDIGVADPWPDNKNRHLKLVLRTINEKMKIDRVVVRPQNVLLIDDDLRNVDAARKDGYHAWWVNPAVGFILNPKEQLNTASGDEAKKAAPSLFLTLPVSTPRDFTPISTAPPTPAPSLSSPSMTPLSTPNMTPSVTPSSPFVWSATVTPHPTPNLSPSSLYGYGKESDEESPPAAAVASPSPPGAPSNTPTGFRSDSSYQPFADSDFVSHVNSPIVAAGSGGRFADSDFVSHVNSPIVAAGSGGSVGRRAPLKPRPRTHVH